MYCLRTAVDHGPVNNRLAALSYELNLDSNDASEETFNS